MKKILILFVGFIFILACSDVEVEPSQDVELKDVKSQYGSLDLQIESLPVIEKVIVPTNLSGSSFDKSMGLEVLKFKTLEDYTKTQDILQRLSENHDDAFVNKYNHLSDEELNNIEDEIGHDAQKPITDFEDKMNFNSLRKNILAKEEIFLNQEYPNWNEDPDDHFIFDDEERALLNKNAEVIVANNIYQFNENGYVKRNLTSNISETVANEDIDIILMGPVCRRTGRDVGYHNFSGKYRIKWKNRFRGRYTSSGFDNDNIKATTTSYKKKRKKWKKWRTTISAGINGRIRTSHINGSGTCSDPSLNVYNNLKTSRSKKVKFKIYRPYLVIPGHLGLRLGPQEMFSVHKQNSNTYKHEIYD